MRTIVIPAWAIHAAISGSFAGTALRLPVAVDWSELKLTEEQTLANAIALSRGEYAPYDDHSIFAVEIPFVKP